MVGNESLRQEVESLLTQEGATGSFLEAPALEVAARGLAQEQARPEGDEGGMVRQDPFPLPGLGEARCRPGWARSIGRATSAWIENVALKVLPAHHAGR